MIKSKPHILALYNYLDEIKKRNKKITPDEVVYSINGDCIEVLRYYLEKDKSLLYKKYTNHSVNVISGFKDSLELLSLAAKYGRSDIVCYLETLDYTKWDYSEAFAWAPISNSLTLVEHLSKKAENYHKDEKTFIRNAATVGSIQMLDWFGTWIGDSYGGVFCYNMYDVLVGSIIGNHLNVIRHYFDQKPLRPYYVVYKLAAKFNRLDILQYLHSRNYFSSFMNETGVMDGASENGHLEALEWLHYNCSAYCSSYAMDFASRNGHLQAIQWLHENRTEGCTTDAMDGAAENGHLEIVKWLHQNRTVGCTTNAIDLAALNGHIHVMKWLHENRTEGCTTYAMDWAAQNGHFEAIKWLWVNRTEGHSSHTVINAARHGNLEILKWLYENCNIAYSIEAIDSAALGGNLEVIKWLHEAYPRGCTYSAMDSAALSGHLEVVVWLHENRTEGCTTDAMDYAIINSNLEVAKWLYENRTEGCTARAIEWVSSNSHSEIGQWAQECGLQPVNQNRIWNIYNQCLKTFKNFIHKIKLYYQ